MVLAQIQMNRPMKQNRGSIKDPHIHGNTTESLQFSDAWMIFLINPATAIRLSSGKRRILLVHIIHKNKFQMDADLHVKDKTILLLEEKWENTYMPLSMQRLLKLKIKAHKSYCKGKPHSGRRYLWYVHLTRLISRI